MDQDLSARQPAAEGRNGRSTIVYDDECNLCRRQIAWLRARAPQNAFDYVPMQTPEIRERYPELRHADFNEVQEVRPDGMVKAGADAVQDVLRKVPRWRRLAALYVVPGVRPIARAVYHWISKHRHKL